MFLPRPLDERLTEEIARQSAAWPEAVPVVPDGELPSAAVSDVDAWAVPIPTAPAAPPAGLRNCHPLAPFIAPRYLPAISRVASPAKCSSGFGVISHEPLPRSNPSARMYHLPQYLSYLCC
jgi:hypothetical protein